MSDTSEDKGPSALQRFSDATVTRLAWVAGKAIVTAIVTGSVAMATGYVREMRDDIKVATQKADMLTITQHDTVSRVANLEKVSDATVLALQQMDKRVTGAEFDIGYLKAAAARDAQRSRPTQ